MAEVLSQSEIDALLSAVSTGAVDTQEAPPSFDSPKKGSDWVAYDLTSQEKIVRGRLAALQGIHERFARNFRLTLANALKKSVTINVTSIDFIKFGDYLSNVLLPVSMNVVEMKGFKGYNLFVVSSKLAYALVDSYYGGSERPFSKIGGREEFTNIENNMIQKVATMAIKDLEDAWKLNYPMKFDYIRSESNPHFVGSIHNSELVAVINLDIEFENLSGPFVVIVQLRALESIMSHLAINVTGEVNEDNEKWRNHWMNEVLSLEMHIKAELGVAESQLKDIQMWKIGDTLLLQQDAVEPINVYIEDIPKLKGLMGTYRGNSAIRLVQDLTSKKKGE